MSNYLQGLPFNAGQGNTSDCDCPGQSFDPAKFKLYAQADRLPTFVLRLPPLGTTPDLTYAGECLSVFTCDGGERVASLTQSEVGSVLHKDSVSYYLTYDGSPIDGLNMECGKCYRIKIMSYWSEPFWITDIPQSKITIEFTNKSQLGDVPYQSPLNFINRIVIDGEICGLEAELFENKKSEANGKESITFQRLTERKALYIYNAPEFIQKLIGSIPVHEGFKVLHKGETIEPLFKRSLPTSTKNGCCDYDLVITMPIRDLKNIGGKCDSDTEGALTPVTIPDGLPDSCDTDDDYEPTSETLCLELGKVPPPIIPPITPVGTPPVGAPCPPVGFVVSNKSITTACAVGFVFEGKKYRTKATKKIADGSCGVTEEIEYLDPCEDVVTTTHDITNILCDTIVIPVPPVGTPPVGSPPVGTPPVGSPPVGTPPVGTPPVGSPPVGTPPVGSPPVGTPPPTSQPSFTNWSIGGWNGEVWRPANYTSAKTYSVIYIHDGVTLYAKNGHPDGNWNLDQRIQSMITAGTMRDTIIVSINTPDRMRTLLPDKPFYTMSGGDQSTIASNNGGTPRADETLNFMVSQLKPYIDGNYSTKTSRLDTVIAGASMGGIFAAYAFGERNDIFGKMAALSPHYQGTLISVNDNLYTDDMVNYISNYFPNASAGGMIYFDRGTTSLDENYATPQNSVNSILAGKGYNSTNLKTLVFNGGGHTNQEWGEHVPGVFSFLLPPIGTPPVGTPPVGGGSTYPSQFEFLMTTTGGGFEPDSPDGMDPQWRERFEAANYSWGWGITGITMFIPWDKYEITQGQYRTDGLIKVINYCNARSLSLSICFLNRRTETDGFLQAGERVKGSLGKVYIEGVPGMGAVYSSYGCDRVNAMIFNCVKSIATTLKTYSKAFYMMPTAGHAGELVNYVMDNGSATSQIGDFCDDSLSRFNTWCTQRGLATPGTPPMIHGGGVGWPNPDWSQARGVEFGRFLSYSLAKYYKNFNAAVKSVSNLPCIYFYAAASNVQLRATSNANMNYIAGPGQGMYGSEGDGLYDHAAKIRVNSVNLGTFPNGMSGVEFDPDDLSTYRYNQGGAPPYGQASPQWQILKNSAENLYSKGCRIIHMAMAFHPDEIRNASQVLQQLRQTYIGKPYVRPAINSSNTVVVEVTEKYRASQDLVEGIDTNTKYVQYTDNNFWGGVNPPA